MTSIATWRAISKVAERLPTKRNVQPENVSPVFMRTMFFVFSSTRIAMPSGSPAMAPSSVSRGRVGGLTATGAGSVRIGSAGRAGGGREREKSGRSRVAVKVARGMVHKGLPALTTTSDVDGGVDDDADALETCGARSRGETKLVEI